MLQFGHSVAPEMQDRNATLSLRAQSGMVFAGRSEAIPLVWEIASSQRALLAMTPAELPRCLQHDFALVPVQGHSILES